MLTSSLLIILKYNFKPSYSILTLRASWLVWYLDRFYHLSRCRFKWDATIVYISRAICEKQLTALHVVHTFHLFDWYVFALLTKMRTETKTVPSTWYIFNFQECTHQFSHMCLILSLACMRNRPHKHTHTNKKDTVCLMTSAHLSNFHHDECISFLITQLPKNKRKFIPKILKVHINRIQLYLYSSSPRNKCKAKP